MSSARPAVDLEVGEQRLELTDGSDVQAYRVPKRQVLAQVALKGHAPKAIRLYLCDCGESQWGQERPSDLLNSGNGFIPATDPDGHVVLLQRDAVKLLSVPAEFEVGAGYPEEVEQAGVTTTHEMELLLDDGTSLQGSVTYLRPAGRRRLQDFLNSSEMFFPVRTGDVVQLVNRGCVVSVLPRGGEDGFPRRRAEDAPGAAVA